MDTNVFAVLGGDERYAMLASMLAQDGYTVFAAGLDNGIELTAGAVHTDALTAAAMAQAVVLPMPPTLDGATLNAPLAQDPIELSPGLCELLRGVHVFVGLSSKLCGVSEAYGSLRYFDYTNEESFQIRNAQATAEGALAVAISNMPVTICGSKCLVAGFGRIGKLLASMLRSLGAEVMVAARKSSDFAYIESGGMTPVGYDRLNLAAGQLAVAINTVPAKVFGKDFLSKLNRSTVVIDLASKPGGVDFAAAQRLGIKTIHALALPGKYSPMTAAGIIKETVLAMIKEEQA